jgi:cytochrome o ubiquinol oxidase subunit 2
MLGGLAIGLMLLLSGCNLVILNPKGVIAAEEKELMLIALCLMLIIVIPVIILTFVIAIRYRASNKKAKYTPDWSHSIILEAIWWTVPIIIISILGYITWVTAHKLDPYRPLESKVKPITIQVIALDWKWLFIYPQENIATINFVAFPVNTPINFEITADAPMNAFQIPALGGQIYAMAGMRTKLHYMANEIGEYNGRSVSFSGDGFSGMTFVARVTSQESFNQWVNTVKHGSHVLTMAAYDRLVQPSQDNQVAYYSSVANDLFNNVMMKFMMPMSNNMGNNLMPT